MAGKDFINPPTPSPVNQQDVIKPAVKQYSIRIPAAAQDNQQISFLQQTVPISAASLQLDHNYCLLGEESKINFCIMDTNLKSDVVGSNQPPPFSGVPMTSTTRVTRQSAKRQLANLTPCSSVTGSLIRQYSKRRPPTLTQAVSSTSNGSVIEKTKKMKPLPPLTFINGSARKSDGTPWKPMDEVKKLLFGPQVVLTVKNSSDDQQSDGGSVKNNIGSASPVVELSSKSPLIDVGPTVTNSGNDQHRTTFDSDGTSVKNNNRSSSPTVQLSSKSTADVSPAVTSSDDGQHRMISIRDEGSVINGIGGSSPALELSYESPPNVYDVVYAYQPSPITRGSEYQLCAQPYRCSSPISPPWSCSMDASYSPTGLYSFDATSPQSMESTDGMGQFWGASLSSTGRNHSSSSLPTFKQAFGKNRSGCFDSKPIMSSSITTVAPLSLTTSSWSTNDSMVSSSHIYSPAEERDLSCNYQSLLEDAMSEELEDLRDIDFDAFFARQAQSSTGKSRAVELVGPVDQFTSTAKVTVPVMQQFWTSSPSDAQPTFHMPADVSMKIIPNDSMHISQSRRSMDIESVEPRRLQRSFFNLRSF